MKSRSPINIGIVGLGRLGRQYARYFLNRIPGARLTAVSDVVPAAVKAFAAETPGVGTYTDFRQLLADKSVDAVVVMTPTNHHKDAVVAAARAGKAIFCEKPLSLDLNEARSMKKAVDRHGVFFQLGFMRRFDKAYLTAKQKIDAGEIGKPIVFKSSSRDQFPPSLDYLRPENSGGLFLDMGIHDFDLARWYMGEVRDVYSVGGVLAYPKIRETGDVDNGFTALTFASRCIGNVSLSRSGIYGYGIYTEIVGTKGTIRIGYDRETPIEVLTEGAVTHDTIPGFYERFEQAYISQLIDFVENLQNDRRSPIVCDDGIAAQKIALAATRSLKRGKPVKVG